LQASSLLENPDIQVTAAILAITRTAVSSGFMSLTQPSLIASPAGRNPWANVSAAGSPGFRWPGGNTFNVSQAESLPSTDLSGTDAADVITIGVVVSNLGSF